MAKLKIKTAYERERKPTLIEGETKTQQNFKKECDINYIIAKHQKTGLATHVNSFQGNYADLSQPIDYQTAMNMVINAQTAFESLPSNIRKQFNNDPGEFLAFVDNPENEEAVIELGLKTAPEAVPGSPAPETEPPEPEAEV